MDHDGYESYYSGEENVMDDNTSDNTYAEQEFEDTEGNRDSSGMQKEISLEKNDYV